MVPIGLLKRLNGEQANEPDTVARETMRIERIAMQAVMELERKLGYEPRDVSADKCGCDVESKMPGTGQLRFIAVKGRVAGSKTVTMTKNEILTALNKPDEFVQAIVEVDGEAAKPHYVRQPFQRGPDFGVTSVNYDFTDLLARAREPIWT